MKTFTQQKLEPTNFVSTGLYSVDDVMGGGVPLGRVIEIAGKQSGGKSSLALQIISNFQKEKFKSAYLDIEQTFDSSYAQNIGVNLDKLIFPTPKDGMIASSEEVWETIEDLIEDRVKLIVLDSVAQLLPKAELEGTMDQQHMALAGRINSQSLRKIVPLLSINNSTLLCINQVRDNIGAFGYGAKTLNPGGNALRFAYSIQLEIARIGNLDRTSKGEKVVIGTKNRIKCVKNKLAPPYKQCELINTFGFGFEPKQNIIVPAIKAGIIVKEKNTLLLGDEKLGTMSQFALSDKDYNIINKKLMNK